MIGRSIEKNIRHRMLDGKAIIIMGARQVGKTTLIRQILEGSDESAFWFNGD
jgi:predicted AAA+ superfamily ATPase